jgi:hypothetical protein
MAETASSRAYRTADSTGWSDENPVITPDAEDSRTGRLRTVYLDVGRMGDARNMTIGSQLNTLRHG